MLIPHQKKSFSILFFLLILTVPVALAYYTSAKPEQPFTLNITDQQGNTLLTQSEPVPSAVLDEKIFLAKDEKYVTDDTCIIFKGTKNGKVCLELTIFELDPDVPYPLNFTPESVSDGIWLNNVQYRLVSVKDDILCLSVQDAYRTL
jgi:hypothetical protein